MMLGLLGGKDKAFKACDSILQRRSLSTYEYHALKHPNEIRLLTLQPGHENDELICRISHASIGSNMWSYEALSYTWGEPRLSHTITVLDANTSSHNAMVCSILPITMNCHAALQSFRQVQRERTIWVDAICINQQDVAERSAQVRIMRNIYSSARQVVIWLDVNNLSAEDIEEIVRTMELLYNIIISNHKNNPDGQPWSSVAAASVFMSDRLPGDVRVRWLALNKFFRRPWFSRVWVIQEVAMAKSATILFADKLISWESVEMCAAILHYARSYSTLPIDAAASGIHSTVITESLKSSEKRSQDVLSMMTEIRNKLATDPRDKLYAIIGMMDPAVTPDVDYEVDINICYKWIAVSNMILTHNPFHVLSCCHWSSHSDDLHLPSWVPDWTQTDVPSPFNLYDKVRFSAGGQAAPIFSFCGDTGDILQLTGKIIDIVKEVEDPYVPVALPDSQQSETPDLAFETWQHTRDWFDRCLAMCSRISGSEEADEDSDLLWRLLICNQCISGGPPDTYTRDWYLAFRQIYALDESSSQSRPFDETAAHAGYFEGLWKHRSAGRAFFATKNGHMGWASRCIEPGGLVCVFPGAQLAYVLHPVGNEGQFRMMGECYVHGFMDGEAMSMKHLVMREFQLC